MCYGTMTVWYNGKSEEWIVFDCDIARLPVAFEIEEAGQNLLAVLLVKHPVVVN